jgi:hypothetical protein
MTGWSKGRKRSAALCVAGVVAAVAVLLALPLTSLGSTSPLSTLSSDLSSALKGATSTVQSTVQKVVSSTTRSSTIARSNTASNSAPAQSGSTYTPPQYGTNPHGQGAVADVFLNPSSTRPYTYAPGGNSSQGQDVVVGQGRSEQQSDGSYDAHTTIVGLFGNELLGVNATQGQSNTGPLNALQTSVLNQICTSTNDLICLTVLAADTSATSSGANTHFQTVGLTSKQLAGLDVNAASSDSAITTSGSCQAASGDSQVLGVSTASGVVASAATSKTGSTACSGQTPTQTDSSSVINLGQNGLPIPAAGCADGTPNTAFTPLAPLLAIYCNADDQTQASAPSGVREALTILGLETNTTSEILRATTAASESHAVAPPSTNTCTDTDKDCGSGETCVNGQDPDGDGDCTGNKSPSGNQPSGQKKCKDSDHDCGIGPNGQPETCVNGVDPDGDGDCTAATAPPSGAANCSDSDHDCGIGPNGQREICVNGADPDGDGDCSNQVTALAAKTTLPFTGENVLLVILVGLLLTGGGLALASRLRTSSHKRR